MQPVPSWSHLMGQHQASGTPFKTHTGIIWKCVKLVLLTQHRTVIKQGIWGHEIKGY